ncbi:PoNe immunity protein domain-containing protein [Streptococcus dentapri]|uniref:PoNe immunity protein domain-containing protein n=1 Tax=Streptococcus dentapri TaxID=573564 RepID=A0ABV8CZP2_9STRE
MLRDKLKNEHYFQKLKTEEVEWLKELTDMESIISSDKTRMYYIDLSIINFTLFKISYSMGENSNSYFEYFKDSIHHYSKVFGENSGIFAIIDYLSLAVLFESYRKEFIDDVKILFDKYLKLTAEGKTKQDDFIDFLGVYLLQDRVVNFHSHLEYLNLMGDTADSVIEAQKFWYYAHSEAAWYNSHLRDTDSYYGYWSFDTAALCKIRGIYDERLKDLDYFPYDLLVQKDH